MVTCNVTCFKLVLKLNWFNQIKQYIFYIMSTITLLNYIDKMMGHIESEADAETPSWYLFVSNLFFKV